MKKRILIFIMALSALSLTAFGIINWNHSAADEVETSGNMSVASVDQMVMDVNNNAIYDFFYGIGTRFNSIKRDKLLKAKSFDDFIGKDHAGRIVSYKSLSVIILEDSKQTNIKETGDSGVLTAQQLKLLHSADYSTNIMIRADYTEYKNMAGEFEDSYWTPHLTIVPEKQALYAKSMDVLIDYLRENSKEITANVKKDKVQPGKLYFTVTKNGTISNVRVMSTSGFPSIDESMIELITKMPGIWEPAENSKGEKVDQDLVLSFGSMGC